MNNLCGHQIGYLALVCSPTTPDNGAGGERGTRGGRGAVRSDRGKAKSSENYFQEINQLPEMAFNTNQLI